MSSCVNMVVGLLVTGTATPITVMAEVVRYRCRVVSEGESFGSVSVSLSGSYSLSVACPHVCASCLPFVVFSNIIYVVSYT